MGKMVRYKITVERIEHRQAVFEVDGINVGEAEEKAMEAAGNHDFRQNTVCRASAEIVRVEEAKAPTTRRIWIGGEVNVIESEEDLLKAAIFEQKFADEFNPLPQPVYVDPPREPGGPWKLLQSNYKHTETSAYPGEYDSAEKAEKAAKKINDVILAEIASHFPSIDIPANWDVFVSYAARGRYPGSRQCTVRINGESETITWEARSAVNTWIPKQRIASHIQDTVAAYVFGKKAD